MSQVCFFLLPAFPRPISSTVDCCPSRRILNLLIQAKVFLSRNHTNSVGVALPAAPALDADNVVGLVDDAELETVVDTPLEAAVHVLLPDLDIEVGLRFGECEGPDATVQVRILVIRQPRFRHIENRLQLTREAMGLRVTMRMGQTGRYLERRRAVLPLICLAVILDYRCHEALT